MPIVHLNLLEGREPALVSQCIKEIARVIHETLGAPMETIRVVASEVPSSHWAIGDRTRAEIDAAKKDAAKKQAAQP
jgi:4-oxalocrotonate tautomerase